MTTSDLSKLLLSDVDSMSTHRKKRPGVALRELAADSSMPIYSNTLGYAKLAAGLLGGLIEGYDKNLDTEANREAIAALEKSGAFGGESMAVGSASAEVLPTAEATSVAEGDLPTRMASVSALGETGRADFSNQGQVVEDTAKSKSYGTFGLNTWAKGGDPNNTSMGQFLASYGGDLGLTAPIGSPDLDAQWKSTAQTNPEGLRAAQMDWYQKNIAGGISHKLAGAGLPPEMASDPRVQAYVADRMVQQGAGSVDKHRGRFQTASAAAGGDPAAFMRALGDEDKRNIGGDFKTYLSTNPNNTRGLENRVDRRYQASLGIQPAVVADTAAAKVQPDAGRGHDQTQMPQGAQSAAYASADPAAGGYPQQNAALPQPSTPPPSPPPQPLGTPAQPQPAPQPPMQTAQAQPQQAFPPMRPGGGLNREIAMQILTRERVNPAIKQYIMQQFLPQGVTVQDAGDRIVVMDKQGRTVREIPKGSAPQRRDGEVTIKTPEGEITAIRNPDGSFSLPKVQGMPEGGVPPKMTPDIRKEIDDTDKAVASGRSTLSTIGLMKKLNENAYENWGAESKTWLARNLPFVVSDADKQKGINTTMLNNLATEAAVTQLKEIFGGQPTEGERKVLLELQASANKSKEERSAIFDQAQRVAEKRLAIQTEKGEALRSGKYYQKGYKPSQYIDYSEGADAPKISADPMEGRTATDPKTNKKKSDVAASGFRMSDLPAGFVLDEIDLPQGFVLDAAPTAASKTVPALNRSGAYDRVGMPQRSFLEKANDVVGGAASGVANAAIGLAGLPVDLGSLISRGTEAGAKALGVPEEIRRQYLVNQDQLAPDRAGSSGQIRKSVEQLFGQPLYKPETTAGEVTKNIADFSAGALLPGGIARRVVGGILAPGVTSEAAGRFAEGTSFEGPARVAGGLIGGIAGGARMPTRSGVNTPSVGDLKEASDILYKQAKGSGVVISQPAFRTAVDDIAHAVPEIDKTLHPNATAALSRLYGDANAGSVSLRQADTLRQIIKDAAASNSAGERRIATIMKDRLDDFLENLSPAQASSSSGVHPSEAAQVLAGARSLWTRMRKGEVIEDAVANAKLSAPGWHGAGYENALRLEFKNIARNKNKMRGFSKDEQDAIKKVAMGGPIQEITRWIGKFAPTGAVSAGISGGLGYAATQDPMQALAVPAVGGLGRVAATAIRSRNARLASELMRRGQSSQLPSRNSLARALLASQGVE